MATKIKVLILSLLASLTGISQAPAGFPFQSIIKDNNGVLAKSTDAYVKCRIIRSLPTGSVSYEEVHQVRTNDDGIFSIIIGQGTRISGEMSLYAIDWGKDLFYLNLKTVIPSNTSIKWFDPSLNYTDIGTTQLWSVPYALYAGNSNQANIISSSLNTTGLLTVNGGNSMNNVVLGTNNANIGFKGGKSGSLLTTDSSGQVAWTEVKNTRLVSGVLRVVTLYATVTGDTIIPATSLVTTKILIPEVEVGDPVFVTSVEDNIGFNVYSAFVAVNGEVTIRLSNLQDQPAVLSRRKFSILIVK
ncbi:MAG: hypothetical protein HYI21_10825 [Sediminibacterium sp. Gen4]|jgi:hypothetical protein|uniref:hypothetical protein n=1 Tax=Sediminibacterium sp. Gen4 TaxID=2736285 RepID=UPI0015B82B64|nr:hypothetical protein [Sediminibacterium sp. Gen4]MBW0162188.1 hypothetical protein [Sediminibacterium sp.]NWK66512.1 hypothetical protein [Sediminibacterium sp. Gen4]